MSAAVRSVSLRVVTVLVLLAAGLAGIVGNRHADAVTGPVDLVYVAVGTNYADALVGAALAALNAAPMLTVATDQIPQATKDALTDLAPVKITILGGPAAVSATVEVELGTYTRPTVGNVDRIQGADRFETAALIAAALPAAAKDADLLDGLDSTAFLGAADKAADADQLDGHDHAALRYVALPAGAFAPDGGATVSTALSLLDGQETFGAMGLIIPPDYTAGDPLSLYTMLNSAVAPCDAVVAPTNTRVLFGDDWVPLTWSSEAQDGDGAIALLGRYVVQPVTYTLDDPSAVRPGAHLQFRLSRQGDHPADTCTSWVGSFGAELRY